MKYKFVYMTVGNLDEAKKIGQSLVEQKLAACVNILPQMHSIYEWQGKIQNDNEVVLIAKTQHDCFQKLKDLVKKLHSYECPCIISLPIEDGNPDFFKWITQQTQF